MCSQILIAMISSHILDILLPYFVGLLLHLGKMKGSQYKYATSVEVHPVTRPGISFESLTKHKFHLMNGFATNLGL